MKKILLTSTAMTLAAGMASADFSTSASGSLTWGNFGTGALRAGADSAGVTDAPDAAWSTDADFVISMSGEDGGIAYSTGITLDDSDNASANTTTISSNGLSIAFGTNDFGGITTAAQADGESDNHGDLLISYAANGLTFSYEVDTDDSVDDLAADADLDKAYVANVGFSMGGATIGIKTKDADGGGATSAVNTYSIGYEMGDMSISYSADDQTGAANTWDASVTMALGESSLTLSTDEAEDHRVSFSTTMDTLTVTAAYEVDSSGAGADDNSETELSIATTLGGIDVTMSYDSGQGDSHYGDEAQTVATASWTSGGLTVTGKANNKSEYELSTGFTF